MRIVDQSSKIEESDSCSTTSAIGQLISLQHLPGAKEELGKETSNKFKERQCIRGLGAHQDERVSSSELTCSTRELVHEGECVGCLFSHPDTLKISEIPQVHLQVNNVPIHLHPVWLVISTKNFHQAVM